MKVKALDQIAAKWSQRAQAAGPAYAAGVQAPKVSWSAATSNAKDSWASGVQAAATNGRFAAGVTKAGDAKWQAGATGKGVQRYPQGVAGAQSNYQQGFQRFAAALAAANLPNRMPKGDPANQQRSNMVATLLHNVKMGKAS